jgi:hypothetical protein
MSDRPEWPLCGGHFTTVNDGSWPFSDQFAPSNPTFSARKRGRQHSANLDCGAANYRIAKQSFVIEKAATR